MTLALFLVDSLPSSDALVLDGDEGRHAASVKRLGVGELVLVGDGRGAVATCAVASVRPGVVSLQVVSRVIEALPVPRLIVVQALPKGERAELAVELMTELGVDEIVPWAAERSIVQWSGDRAAKSLERWRRTAREAAKQSRRAWVPTVTPAAATEEVVALLAASGGLVLHEDAATALASAPLPASDAVVVVVGPEGGISPSELERFEAVGAVSVRLGAPVLRTSTAGAAALAALSVRLGRWSAD